MSFVQPQLGSLLDEELVEVRVPLDSYEFKPCDYCGQGLGEDPGW